MIREDAGECHLFLCSDRYEIQETIGYHHIPCDIHACGTGGSEPDTHASSVDRLIPDIPDDDVRIMISYAFDRISHVQ